MKQIYLSTLSEENKHAAAHWLRGGLLALSRGYQGVLSVRKALYDSGFLAAARIGVPVISVGNLTWGGTGKTPFVIEICRRISALGLAPAVLLRGYGADESRQLAASLPEVPIGVGADRTASARSVLSRGPVDVFVLDDAFQHWALARDWDIVLVNATAPFGNGFLIPRGQLREPLSALRRAGAIVLTHADRVSRADLDRLREKVAVLAPQALIAEAAHHPDALWRPGEQVSREGERFAPENLRGEGVVAVSGIAMPDLFVETLRNLGAQIKKTFLYEDHHPFTEKEIAAARTAARELGCRIVTTEKDYFRGPELFRGADLWVLKIRLKMTQGAEEFMTRLETLVGGGRRREPSHA